MMMKKKKLKQKAVEARDPDYSRTELVSIWIDKPQRRKTPNPKLKNQILLQKTFCGDVIVSAISLIEIPKLITRVVQPLPFQIKNLQRKYTLYNCSPLHF